MTSNPSDQQPEQEQPRTSNVEISTEEEITEKAAILEKRKELLANLESFIACVNASIENGLFKTLDEKQGIGGRSFLRRIKESILGSRSSSSSSTTSNVSRENSTSSQKKKGEEALRLILNKIQEARNELKSAQQNKTYDLSKCEKFLSEAKQYYANALYSVGRGWIFENEYAGYIWIWLAGLLVSVFALYYFGVNIQLSEKLHVPDAAAINAVTWGVIGAVLRAIWFLKEKVDERGFRKSWNVYFISIPFLGGILGGVVYLIVFAGLGILTGPSSIPANTTGLANTTGSANNTTNAITNPSISAIAIIPFSALAGYNWEWAIGVFNQIGERFPSKTTSAKDILTSIKK
jgi:hypothetical protein